MRGGKKLPTPASKELAGTYRPDRHANIVSLVPATVPADIPQAPEWLSAGAKEVWAADLPRVVACGSTSIDSHMFALYTVRMAEFIACVKAAQPAQSAAVAELRRLMELLGMAGVKSRLARVGAPAPEKKSAFTVRK